MFPGWLPATAGSLPAEPHGHVGTEQRCSVLLWLHLQLLSLEVWKAAANKGLRLQIAGVKHVFWDFLSVTMCP